MDHVYPSTDCVGAATGFLCILLAVMISSLRRSFTIPLFSWTVPRIKLLSLLLNCHPFPDYTLYIRDPPGNYPAFSLPGLFDSLRC